MPSLRFLRQDEWQLLREVRLAALLDCPSFFLSTYEQELQYDEERWRTELAGGRWLVDLHEGRPSALLGAAAEADIGKNEMYLSYLWVTPERRRSGIATGMVTTMLDRLRESGVERAWLWVLDGNDPARRLYENIGFTSTGERQPLPQDPSRCEERMTLELT